MSRQWRKRISYAFCLADRTSGAHVCVGHTEYPMCLIIISIICAAATVNERRVSHSLPFLFFFNEFSLILFVAVTLYHWCTLSFLAGKRNVCGWQFSVPANLNSNREWLNGNFFLIGFLAVFFLLLFLSVFFACYVHSARSCGNLKLGRIMIVNVSVCLADIDSIFVGNWSTSEVDNCKVQRDMPLWRISIRSTWH